MRALSVAVLLAFFVCSPAMGGSKNKCHGNICRDHDPGITAIQSPTGVTRSNMALANPAQTRTQKYGSGWLRTGYDTNGKYWYSVDNPAANCQVSAFQLKLPPRKQIDIPVPKKEQ